MEPDFFTKEAETPLATSGSNAECLIPLLSWCLLLLSWSVVFLLPPLSFFSLSAQGSKVLLNSKDSVVLSEYLLSHW